MRANSEQRAELNRWVEATDFDHKAKIEAVTNIYNQLGIRQLCEEKINYYFQQGLQCLKKVSVSDERKQCLLNFTYDLMNREI